MDLDKLIEDLNSLPVQLKKPFINAVRNKDNGSIQPFTNEFIYNSDIVSIAEDTIEFIRYVKKIEEIV